MSIHLVKCRVFHKAITQQTNDVNKHPRPTPAAPTAYVRNVRSHMSTAKLYAAHTAATQTTALGLISCMLITQPFYIQPADSSSMTLFVPKWRSTIQTNRMIPSMTRYAAATRSRRCPRESEPLDCLKFESKQRVIFPLATVAMAYWEHAEYKLLL